MRPRPTLLWLVAVWLGLAVWTTLQPEHDQWFVWFGLVVLAWALLSLWLLWRLPQPVAERTVAGSLPVGVRKRIGLRIENTSKWRLRMLVFDHMPSDFEVAGGVDGVGGMPRQLNLADDTADEIFYRAEAQRRGHMQFGKTQVVYWRRFGFWRRSVQVGKPELVRVYPNFSVVTSYALLAVDNRLSEMGIRRRQRRGEGLDFHQLREYREGDLMRQIDWKATSRRRQLISREYQDERDQQVVFLLDSGRRMHARDGDLSHFDHTLNAVLLLSYVAIRQGDAVSLLTFSGNDRFLPPQKGPAALNTMLNQVYDLHSTLQPSDYLEAATRVMHHIPRRALVVLLTNLQDEDNDELLPALEMLRHRHLVLLASLRENAAQEVLTEPVRDLDSALRYCAASGYVRNRRKALEDLKGRGAQVLDVPPRELPISVVNRYLDIKRTGVL